MTCLGVGRDGHASPEKIENHDKDSCSGSQSVPAWSFDHGSVGLVINLMFHSGSFSSAGECSATEGGCKFEGKRKATPHAAQLTVAKASKTSETRIWHTTVSIRIKGVGPVCR